MAPNISYNYLKSGDTSTNPFSVGGIIGWQWFPGDDFAIGFGIGVDHYFGTVKNNNDEFSNYNGFAPSLRFDIGYAW